MIELEFEDLTERIIGAAIHVHRELGPGFVEAVYARASEIELRARSIPFEREKEIRLFHRGEEIGRHRPDLVVFDRLVVELKAVKDLSSAHFVIVRSYLRAARLEHGLILNFAKPRLEIKRVRIRHSTA